MPRCFGGSAAHLAPPSSDGGLGGRLLQNLLRRALALLLSLLVFGPALGNQTVNGITINEDLPQARRGVAYSYTTPVISGGTAPYSFSLSGPSTLPLRLTLSSAGLVSGVISCSAGNGNHGQDVSVTDSSASPIVASFHRQQGPQDQRDSRPGGHLRHVDDRTASDAANDGGQSVGSDRLPPRVDWVRTPMRSRAARYPRA